MKVLLISEVKNILAKLSKERELRREQAISLEEALKAYTVNPPKAVFAEADQGCIEPGKFADCAVLSQNLFSIPPASIRGVEVDTTIFNGRVVYEK